MWITRDHNERRLHRRESLALTLIEVIVGLVLAGTLLAVTLRATTSHLAQSKRAAKKANAIVNLDQFLSDWALQEFAEGSFQKSAQRCGLRLERSLDIDGRAEFPLGVLVVTQRARRSASLADAEIVRVEIHEGASMVSLAWAEIIRRSHVP